MYVTANKSKFEQIKIDSAETVPKIVDILTSNLGTRWGKMKRVARQLDLSA